MNRIVIAQGLGGRSGCVAIDGWHGVVVEVSERDPH